MMLVNSAGESIMDVYDFLNIKMKTMEFSSRERALSALKHLYSYCEITNTHYKDFEDAEITRFSEFLQGRDSEGDQVEFIFYRNRRNSTHDQYFNALRGFLEYVGHKSEVFFDEVTVSVENSGFGQFGHKKKIKTKKKKTNIGGGGYRHKYVPRYISLNEYKQIMKYIDSSDSKFKLRNKLIINLLFLRGCRIGEVLGITIEDVMKHPTDDSAGILYLRNRVSDKKYQKAKGCIKPKRRDEYSKSTYWEKDNGYQEITLPKILIKQMKEYLEDSRDLMMLSKKVRENIMKYSIADSVKDDYGTNFYLFLNKDGNPLSSSGWGKFLKEIYRECGINIDIGYKENNLSHRFRHGYAMYLMYRYKGIDENQKLTFVKGQLRHESIASTLIYTRPDERQSLKDSEKVVESILMEVVDYDIAQA